MLEKEVNLVPQERGESQVSKACLEILARMVNLVHLEPQVKKVTKALLESLGGLDYLDQRVAWDLWGCQVRMERRGLKVLVVILVTKASKELRV